MSYTIKELKTGYKYWIADGYLRTDRFHRNTESPICEYRLSQVQSITTIDSIENDTQRANAEYENSERQRKSSQTGRILMGAAIGGALDAISGDDTILDGALLGSIFGWALSPGQADRREPVAHIMINFRDGESIALKVDRAGLSILLSNVKINLDGPMETSKILRPYNATEIQQNDALMEKYNDMAYSAIIGFLIAAVYFIVQINQGSPAPQQVSGKHMADLLSGASSATWMLSNFVQAILVLFVSGLIAFVAIKFMRYSRHVKQ